MDEIYKTQAVNIQKSPVCSMDDLVVTGALGLLGIYLVIFIFLFAVYSVTRMLYTLFAAGDSGQVTAVIIVILSAALLYAGIGCWLRKTDRI